MNVPKIWQTMSFHIGLSRREKMNESCLMIEVWSGCRIRVLKGFVVRTRREYRTGMATNYYPKPKTSIARDKDDS